MRRAASRAKAMELEVTIALPRHSAVEGLRHELEADGFQVVPSGLGLQRPGKGGAIAAFVRDGLEVLRWIVRVRPDGVLVEMFTPDLVPGALLALRMSGIRTAVRFHLVPPGRSVSEGRRRLARWNAAGRVRWVGVSTPAAEDLRRMFDLQDGQVGVVENQIEAPRDLPDRSEARRALGLGSEAFAIVSVARLSAQKNLELIVDGAPAVRAQVPGAVFLIVGQGPEREALETRIEKLADAGAVRLLGRREDVGALLAAADVFVMPSRFEGSPLALQEAMHAALPIVASDIPAHRSALTSGIDALLVDPDDDVGFAKAVVTLARDAQLRSTLGHNARSAALRRPSAASAFDALMSLLKA